MAICRYTQSADSGSQGPIKATSRAQAAMEYLMTYGWAILVIAVVMVALFALGVFGGNRGTSSCVATSGFICQNPVLNATGNLSVVFGEIGHSITVTGTGCTTNSTPAIDNPISGESLSSGQSGMLLFHCQLQSNAIGTQFSGKLWIQYNTQYQTGLYLQFASVYASVSTTAAASSSVTTATTVSTSNVLQIQYVPITITNSQSTAAPAGFQQMLTIPSSSYSPYINSAWSNVEFTTAPAASGSTIPAWVESGNSNTVSSTIVWVKLPSQIPANGNTVIYMDFMSSNVMSSSGPTGEAPQLSTNYGQYDDGGLVFTQYGGGGATGWGQFTFVEGTWLTSNGYLQQTATTGSYGAGPAALIESQSYQVAGNYVLGMAFNYTTETSPRVGVIAAATLSGGGDPYGFRFIGQQGDNNAGFISLLNDLKDWAVSDAYQGAASTPYTMVITDDVGTWSGNLYSGYGTEASSPITSLSPTSYSTTNNNGASAGYVGVSAGYYNGTTVVANPINVQWFYVRSLPPGGVMPSISLGPVT